MYVIQAGAHSQLLECLGTGNARADLRIDLGQFLSQLNMADRHLFSHTFDGRGQGQARFHADDHQVQRIWKRDTQPVLTRLFTLTDIQCRQQPADTGRQDH
ncbi:hypothetical protein D3C84_552000 [compost metagenome]